MGIDLLREVQSKLITLEHQNDLESYRFLVLLIVLLRQRDANAEPEPEIVAFLCIGDHAQRTGLTALARAVGLGGTGDNLKCGQDVDVMLMSVHEELTPKTSSLYSGHDEIDLSLVAVGVGAIGSQVVEKAVRGGLARWHIIDNDYLLPHNLVRHALGGDWLGHAKASALAFEANTLLDEPTIQATVADVLSPDKQAKTIQKTFAEAHAIVDLSASVAVARHLAHDVPATARRCSIFVSPSGKDLVFIGEDIDRKYRLDHIEMQYYRAIASNEQLSGHLLDGISIGSCRTITSRVPQYLMGLHAAQGVRILRSWLLSKTSIATVVRTEA
ncbi:MAG: ThiF family adenylyltransferase, partial [bacterium]|nr:ThiF family adenylyltransferase [bacterium]